jgi:hypothetical protein
MVSLRFVRRAALVLVALLVASGTGTPTAGAADSHHRDVKRLWSQFPLGPRLKIGTATHTKPSPPPPNTHRRPPGQGRPASARTSGQGNPPPSWLIALIATAGVLAIAILAWRRHPPLSARDRPTPSTAPTPPATETAHPWTSGGTRTVETLPRAELFAMANTLGIPNTVAMSRDELIDVVRRRTREIGTESSEASDRELVHYAAVYAAACRAGNPAPILAVTEAVSPTTEEPGAYSSHMVAEARRRGLLTRHGAGKPGGELTARAKALLSEAESDTRA